MAKTDTERYLANWLDERNTAFIYESLAEIEKDANLAEIYRRMAPVELRHAEHWEKLMIEAGQKPPVFKPSLRTRILIWLAKRMGPSVIIQSLQAGEQDGTQSYTVQPEAEGMANDERSHARLLNQMSGAVKGGMEGEQLAMLEGRHRTTGGNALRAAVLGANDGMVSNLSLVMGVAGASANNKAILIAGLAGLLAGACSMALGEWLSVQSSRELFSNQIKIEGEEVEQAPEEEAEELALIYESRGLDHEQASALAQQIMKNREHAVETLAKEELGINPEELGGSAWEASITSFILFALGAIVPVCPFLFINGQMAIWVSIAFSIVGLFLLGAVVTLFTGRTVLFSGMRMVVFGMLAAAVTFGIGHLLGTVVGG
ncbi:MAG TPA: VIT1/CCC1 family protein [Longilinea sp.]|nr:VIT1/CCC1 family protein [Longilinea sp.]